MDLEGLQHSRLKDYTTIHNVRLGGLHNTRCCDMQACRAVVVSQPKQIADREATTHAAPGCRSSVTTPVRACPPPCACAVSAGCHGSHAGRLVASLPRLFSRHGDPPPPLRCVSAGTWLQLPVGITVIRHANLQSAWPTARLCNGTVWLLCRLPGPPLAPAPLRAKRSAPARSAPARPARWPAHCSPRQADVTAGRPRQRPHGCRTQHALQYPTGFSARPGAQQQ
jgi:hypothetical protein